MTDHQLGHALVASGFWLSGIAIGYVLAKLDRRAMVPAPTSDTTMDVPADPKLLDACRR